MTKLKIGYRVSVKGDKYEGVKKLWQIMLYFAVIRHVAESFKVFAAGKFCRVCSVIIACVNIFYLELANTVKLLSPW